MAAKAAATPIPTATATPAGPTATATPVPSPIIGHWSFRGETGDRPIVGTLVFQVEDSELAGAYVAPSGKATRLLNLRVGAGQIAFDIVGPLGTWHLVGTLTADRMAGTFETVTRTVPWTAARFSPARTATPRP